MWVFRILSSLLVFEIVPTVWVQQGWRMGSSRLIWNTGFQQLSEAGVLARVERAKGSGDYVHNEDNQSSLVAGKHRCVLNGVLYLLSQWHIQLSDILLLFLTLCDLTKTLLKLGEIILNTSKRKFFDWNHSDVFHNFWQINYEHLQQNFGAQCTFEASSDYLWSFYFYKWVLSYWEGGKLVLLSFESWWLQHLSYR